MANIVFDLDGTLIDSAPDIHAIANKLLKEDGYPNISLSEARDFIGNGVATFVKKMRDLRHIPDEKHEDLVARFISYYEDAVELTMLYPNVFEALEVLKKQGHQLGLCTNKPIKPCLAALDHFNLTQFFDTVWGGDSLPTRKPDPAPLQAAFDALGENANLYVGDSEVDAATAQNAKVPFLLFAEGYRKSPVAQIPHAQSFLDFKVLPVLVSSLLAE